MGAIVGTTSVTALNALIISVAVSSGVALSVVLIVRRVIRYMQRKRMDSVDELIRRLRDYDRT